MKCTSLLLKGREYCELFYSSLQLTFPLQGSRTQATRYIQELKSMLQRHDISLEVRASEIVLKSLLRLL